MVPCQGTQPPPEAYIATSGLNDNTARSEPRQKRLLWNLNDRSDGTSVSDVLFRDLIGFRTGRESSIFGGNNGEIRDNSIDEDKFPTVWTNTGVIQGFDMGTMNGRKIAAFEGIPYAEPPVGKLRFQVSLCLNAEYLLIFFSKKMRALSV